MANKVVGVNLFEKAIQPIVDLDSDVIVYVPGYANMGPGEPTLVNASNFTSIFGDTPYRFKTNQSSTVGKNTVYVGNYEKSWLYAKGLVDAGLTVLYQRCNPNNIEYASSAPANAIGTGYVPLKQSKLFNPEVFTDVIGFAGTGVTDCASGVEGGTPRIFAKAKYFGSYYANMKVAFKPNNNGLTTVTVKQTIDGIDTTLEERAISFDPNSSLYIGSISFAYIELSLRSANADSSGSYPEVPFDVLNLAAWYAAQSSANEPQALYLNNLEGLTLTLDGTSSDDFVISDFETLLAGTSSPFEQLRDTDLYESITYLTTGGYYQNSGIIKKIADVAMDIKAMALVDTPDDISTTTNLSTLKSNIVSAGIASNASKATTFVGADTFVVDGYRIVLPDSFGYLQKLGSNIAKAIPPWIPVANNPQGVVSAVASTRPVGYAVKEQMITNDGISINPIIYKPSTGYTIMGNRTLFPTAGVPGPDSFLNCQLVVNTVARSARRAAQKLLIVSTNAQTAFSNWKSAVSKTCDKMLVNGDGLSSYNITKLKKTQPATIDVQIELVVVEGLERFNIYLTYALNME